MILKELIIENIGMIDAVSEKIDKPLILFYGDIKQGKTTILNAVKYALGGSFPDDLLKHGEKEGIIKLIFENESIVRIL